MCSSISSPIDVDDVVSLLKCVQCGMNVLNKEQLKAHISRIHLTWFPYECQYCLSRWPIDIELINHLQTQHPFQPQNVGFILLLFI